MLCEDCGKTFTSSSNFHQHRREQHSDSVNSLNCSFCQRPFVRKFNLKRHLILVHGLHGEPLSEAMSSKRKLVDREMFIQAKKPVYVLSDFYENISSDEEETWTRTHTAEDGLDHLSISSCDFAELGSVDEAFVEEILCEGEIDEQQVYGEEDGERREYEEDGEQRVYGEPDVIRDSPNDDDCGVISDSPSDDDSDLSGESKKTDENNNVTVRERSTICLVLNKTVIRRPDGTEEEIRDSQIVYSKDLNPEDINFRDVASEILREVSKHFEDGNIRIVRGDLSV